MESDIRIIIFFLLKKRSPKKKKRHYAILLDASHVLLGYTPNSFINFEKQLVFQHTLHSLLAFTLSMIQVYMNLVTTDKVGERVEIDYTTM